jgi:putative PEP-CTERM system histidine kinase
MITLDLAITAACAALYALLAVIHILSRRRSVQKTLFILSCLTLSAAMLFLSLAIASPLPAQALFRLQIFIALMIFTPAFLLPFFVLFGRDTAGGVLRARLPGMIVLGILLAAAAVLLPIAAVVKLFHFEPGAGFWGFTVTGSGIVVAILALIANVFYMHAFENMYRSSTVAARTLLKYPLLGVISASIVNFAVSSRILSLHLIDRDHLAAGAAGLMLFGVSMLYAGARYPIFEIRTPISRKGGQSAVSVTVAGLYLVAVALISYLSGLTGMPYDRFSLTVLGLFAVFLLLAVAISGAARRRLRRFVNENFRPGTYNYRREWHHYTRLMAASMTVEELLSNTISSLCDTVMVKRGLIWVDVDGGRMEIFGLEEIPVEAEALRDLCSSLAAPGVTIFDASRLARAAAPPAQTLQWVSAVAMLGGTEEPRGLIALGRKDFGARWTVEDREFLSTIADQTVVTLDNILMENRLLESKQLESFNRFASFVIHDLKNTVGMLSLTAANARDNIHDRSFQADAIDTIERSVDRMRALIDSLNAHRSPTAIDLVKVDVAKVVAGRIVSLRQAAQSKGVDLSLAAPDGLETLVDPDAVRRIVENLVLNGIEAVEPGGSVLVTLSAEERGFALSVEDDGAGFDPRYLEDGLFRAFRTTKTSGLGVGLVLCKSLAEAHGGTITAGNRPGGGAVVRIVIPGSD